MRVEQGVGGGGEGRGEVHEVRVCEGMVCGYGEMDDVVQGMWESGCEGRDVMCGKRDGGERRTSMTSWHREPPRV